MDKVPRWSTARRDIRAPSIRRRPSARPRWGTALLRSSTMQWANNSRELRPRLRHCQCHRHGLCIRRRHRKRQGDGKASGTPTVTAAAVCHDGISPSSSFLAVSWPLWRPRRMMCQSIRRHQRQGHAHDDGIVKASSSSSALKKRMPGGGRVALPNFTGGPQCL